VDPSLAFVFLRPGREIGAERGERRPEDRATHRNG
jgi:hypothetical protein